MKKYIAIMTVVLFTMSADASAKGKKSKCKKSYTEFSCKEYKHKKRDYFCWSTKKISKAKMESICLKPKVAKKVTTGTKKRTVK